MMTSYTSGAFQISSLCKSFWEKWKLCGSYTHQLWFVDGFCVNLLLRFLPSKSSVKLQLAVKTKIRPSMSRLQFCMADHMAWRRWGQRSPHNAPFRPAVSEVFMLLSLAPECLWFPPRSIFLLLASCYSVCFSLCLPFTFPLSGPSVFYIQKSPRLSLLFLQWNTRLQPDGSPHKFQAECHTFGLLERENECMHGQHNSRRCGPQWHVAAGGKSSSSEVKNIFKTKGICKLLLYSCFSHHILELLNWRMKAIRLWALTE